MKMKSLLAAVTALALFSPIAASAGVIDDLYWGGNGHNYGDVIGDTATYGISSAAVTRSGSVLTIRIATGFAGQAGDAAWAGPHGIGYGDVFLAPAWTPSGSDAQHSNDNAASGTQWTYGFNLADRWSTTGGAFTLYAMTGSNVDNILNSESFLTCAIGSACFYRDGQATAVNTASATVLDTGLTGTWSMTAGSELVFSIDAAGSALANYSTIAMHWGETCQNDVIEGATDVPEPASLALFALGLLGVAGARKRKQQT
jgi:hypothetical protein